MNIQNEYLRQKLLTVKLKYSGDIPSKYRILSSNAFILWKGVFPQESKRRKVKIKWLLQILNTNKEQFCFHFEIWMFQYSISNYFYRWMECKFNNSAFGRNRINISLHALLKTNYLL